MNERQSAEDGNVFGNAESDIRKWFRRTVRHEARRRLRRVGDEGGAAGQQNQEHVEGRSRMAEHLNREQRAADRPDDGVNGVPGRIHPRDFIREKFEEIENARDRDDPRMAKDFERMIVWRGDDPMQIYRQAGDEDGEVKIDPGETGQTERNAQKVESFHAEISNALCDCHATFYSLARAKICAQSMALIFQGMLDIRLIREQPDFVKSRLATRGGDDLAKIDEVLRVDAERREAETELQALQADRNRLSKEIGGKRSRHETTTNLESEVRALGDDIARVDREAGQLHSRQVQLLLEVPNLPHGSVPEGLGGSGNRIVRLSEKERPDLPRGALDHVRLGQKLRLFDLERAAKLSGSGFVCFTGAGAKLERALIQFMLDLHTREHGYLELSPPCLVRRDCMEGTGQLPKFEEDMYGVPDDEELFLVPTAEVPVTNFYREEIVAIADLPRKLTAYTPCFRREAGSAGRETRGIIRLHQFDKVELVKITTPEKSYDELEKLTTDAERVLQLLELPYRVIELCTGDLGFGSAKTYDIEVWSPGQNAYLEVSSCSNFEDFQARRMNLRFKDAEGGNRFCHTLNGSGLALPRLFSALIETYQQPDGSIRIPEILQPYFGAAQIR
jgi:seryl-tRNA synthetase